MYLVTTQHLTCIPVEQHISKIELNNLSCGQLKYANYLAVICSYQVETVIRNCCDSVGIGTAYSSQAHMKDNTITLLSEELN